MMWHDHRTAINDYSSDSWLQVYSIELRLSTEQNHRNQRLKAEKKETE